MQRADRALPAPREVTPEHVAAAASSTASTRNRYLVYTSADIRALHCAAALRAALYAAGMQLANNRFVKEIRGPA